MDILHCFLILLTLFESNSAFNSLSLTGPCSRMFCGPGRTCVETAIPCFRPPCPSQGLCVPLVSGRSCPKALGFGACVAYCSTDAECGPTEMCCGSCPRRCTSVGIGAPVRLVGPVIKPGSCPLSRGIPGSCTSSCSSDRSCPGITKCCGRCPRRCETPVKRQTTSKPGRCPSAGRDVVGTCVTSCKIDKDCQGDEKCCGNCPRQCQSPVSYSGLKPGRCPMSRRYRVTLGGCNTESKCLRDTDCPGEQKCCGKCPRLCVTPRGTGRAVSTSRRLRSVSTRSNLRSSRTPVTGVHTSRRRRHSQNAQFSPLRHVPYIQYRLRTFY